MSLIEGHLDVNLILNEWELSGRQEDAQPDACYKIPQLCT